MEHKHVLNVHFDVEPEFHKGIARLSSLLGVEEAADGIRLSAVKGDRVGVSLSNGIGTIFYQNTHHFFRELGVFVQQAKESAQFDITEDAHFETIGVMVNASTYAIPTVSSVKLILDHLVLMGYNMMMLYTEDTIELKSRPYFGYMHGRYSREELREIDDYAFDYGIEVIPCLECYGHMSAYLKWEEAKPIKDTGSVLLAREEKTFEFLDELIGEASQCFRSKRIHIGMDEAHDMGRGAFLDKNGYVPRAQIFHEYMARLVQITNKYGYTPMMWSDMYFRLNAEDGFQYYQEDLVVSEETKQAIPEEVQLVFWHYGEEPHCDDYMIKKHQNLERNVIFAGGLWDWGGAFPEHNYAFESMKFSLEACRRNNVHEMMVTSWSSRNLFANLFGLSFSAELCYQPQSTKADLKNRFEACTGGNYEAFYNMCKYHNKFGNGEVYDDFNDRFLGVALFWQDVMEGIYDVYLRKQPMSDYYRACADEMETFHGKWEELYEYAWKVFAFLAVKTEIAEKLVPSYQAGDRDTLRDISERLLPHLKVLAEEVMRVYRTIWKKYYKTTGWWVVDHEYGGLILRSDTAKLRLDEYLSGETSSIFELEEEHLSRNLSAFPSTGRIAKPFAKW